jgi:beta-galactosidase
MKQEVNDLAFSEFRDRLIGTCIWEPLSTWDKVFEKDGKSNEKLMIYDQYKNQSGR